MSAFNTADDVYTRFSGTSMAAPAVSAVMAIYVGWQFLVGDTMAAKDLMNANKLDGAISNFPPPTTQALVNTGIRVPPFLGAALTRRQTPRVP